MSIYYEDHVAQNLLFWVAVFLLWHMIQHWMAHNIGRSDIITTALNYSRVHVWLQMTPTGTVTTPWVSKSSTWPTTVKPQDFLGLYVWPDLDCTIVVDDKTVSVPKLAKFWLIICIDCLFDYFSVAKFWLIIWWLRNP